MDKKFEKKTEFMGVELSGMEQLAFTELTKRLAQHLLESHAEIDRLTEENASLRSQAPAEREWISVNDELPEPDEYLTGDYLVANESLPGQQAVACYNNHYSVWKLSQTDDLDNVPFTITHWRPLPVSPAPPEKPEPLEVKVGKYEFHDNGHSVTLDVLAIRTYSNGLERVIYCYPDDLRSSKDLFDCGVEELQKRLADNNATFIGGDAE